MGLDMYLSKRHYVQNWPHMQPAERHAITVMKGGKPMAIKPERISYVIEQVAYWRKANAIHAWFVKNVQGGVDDCRDYSCDSGDLQKLLDAVSFVLARPREAATVLPTQSGFFFGGTDYDDHYRADLDYTRKALMDLLAEPDADSAEYSYRASW